MRPLLGAIRRRRWWSRGSRTPRARPSAAREIAAAIPRRRIVEIPDAAHLAALERPDAVTGLLTLFLEGR